MKSNRKGFIVPLLITIIAVILIGGSFYLYQIKKNTPAIIDDNNSTKAISSISTIQKNNPITATGSISFKNSSVTYDEGKITECINNYKQIQSKYPNNYTKGQVVVGFSTSTSLVDAKKIITSYGLASDDSAGSFYSKLYVNVAVGQEFLWSCRLQENKQIRYAEPNYGATVVQ